MTVETKDGNMSEPISGYTCQTCGKMFDTEIEFKNRHKKKKKY